MIGLNVNHFGQEIRIDSIRFQKPDMALPTLGLNCFTCFKNKVYKGSPSEVPSNLTLILRGQET